MEIVVKNYLTSVPETITEQMPGFGELFGKFSSEVEFLRQLKQKQRLNRTGYRMTKGNYRDIMVDLGFNTASRIKAYALAINDMVLWAEMDIKPYQFEKMRDSDVADSCMTIYEKGNELVSDLAPYGVTPEYLGKLKEAILDYNNYLPLPRASVVTKKEITATIKATFERIDGLLVQLDTLAIMLKFNEPTFYKKYFNSRKIVVSGGRVIGLRGYITSNEGAPLEKVLVTIEELDGFVTYTTAKGYYQFKNLPEGVFTVTYSRAGFIPVKVPLAFTPTLRLDYDVVLVQEDAVGKVA